MSNTEKTVHKKIQNVVSGGVLKEIIEEKQRYIEELNQDRINYQDLWSEACVDIVELQQEIKRKDKALEEALILIHNFMRDVGMLEYEIDLFDAEMCRGIEMFAEIHGLLSNTKQGVSEEGEYKRE